MKQLLFLVSLIWIAACNNDGKNPSEPQVSETPGAEAPKALTFSIIKTYPHDTSSYTQGLQVYKGELYEGTGNYGHSRLIRVDLSTGKAIQSISLDPRFFGEGITILRDTIYQLTWKERKVLVYTLKDFKKIREYDLGTDGWGLTTDGKDLIASDGSSTLYYYDPNGFKLLRTQTITEAGSLSYNLNELEYIDGFIYANQYQAPYILKIDPGSGHIVAKADLTAIWKRVQTIDPAVDVPNGIAYDSATAKFYITGKLWPELYEIAFSK